MCGIAGIWSRTAAGGLDLRETAYEMGETLRHRGPDAGDVWADLRAGVYFAHRRLSIIDLSPAGNQPMSSSCGKYTIVFNGEIYNHGQIRAELIADSHPAAFRGRSDTEVLIEAIGRWDLDETLQRLNGMFAFAVWDAPERRLLLARDRLGEKPLYYGWAGGAFIFASELKALRAFRGFHPEIDRDALSLFFRHGYIPAPYTIYRDVYKLPPAHSLTVTAEHVPGDLPSPQPYWSMRDVAMSGFREPLQISPEEAVEALDRLLRNAVAMRMEADVPLGAFLSGGIDSSTVVALMQAQSGRPVNTFSIGFRVADYDESAHARAVARHLGTRHEELCLTETEAQRVIPLLASLYDEPFADISQLPTFLVSELARRHVTVSLSGDGGDELFAGYERYAKAEHLWDRSRALPGFLRPAVGSIARAIPAPVWNATFRFTGAMLPRRLRMRDPGAAIYAVSHMLTARTPELFYRNYVSACQDDAGIVLGGSEPQTILSRPGAVPDLQDVIRRWMYADTLSYLPDDILVKLDRASMGVSLEGRVPMLDHRVVEFAWKLPMGLKIRGGVQKWILKQVLARYVPSELFERPKQGFGVPIGLWLRGALRDWAEDLLSESRLQESGYLNTEVVRRRWAEHQEGRHDWEAFLWNTLVFQSWLASADTPSRRAETVAA